MKQRHTVWIFAVHMKLGKLLKLCTVIMTTKNYVENKHIRPEIFKPTQLPKEMKLNNCGGGVR